MHSVPCSPARFAMLSLLVLAVATGTAVAGTVTISSPSNGATVSSSFRLQARASDADGVKVMKVYLDGSRVYEVRSSTLDKTFSASTGKHRVTVQAYDGKNNAFQSTIYVTVGSSSSGVTISSPGDGATVSSPFRLKASASDPDGIKVMKVYLDGSRVYEVRSSTLDKSFSASKGKHRVTVQAYDGKNNVSKSTIYVNVGSTTSSSTSTSSGTKSWSDIEEMSGWDSCTKCAGAGGDAKYSMTRGISSPSLDGNATRFWIGGTTPWSHGLWWRRMSSDTSKTNFVVEIAYYIKQPKNSEGLEFAANQARNNRWYKFSTQCSFGLGVWRTWDSKNSRWVGTSIPCRRPSPYTWTRLKLEYRRKDGKAHFVAFTINGKKHYVNRSHYPLAKSTSGSIGVHYQMNGNKYQHDYSTWVDNMKLTVW